MDTKQTLRNRLDRLEARFHLNTEHQIDCAQQWTASVRFGHQEEDFAEACRLAGLTQPVPGIVLLGEIPPARVPTDFVPSIRPIKFHGFTKDDHHAVA